MVRKLKKKYLQMGMVLCLSMMIFAGCGSSTSDSAATASPDTLEEATASPEATDGLSEDGDDGDLMDDMEDGVDDAVDDTKDAVEDAVDDTEDFLDGDDTDTAE